MVCTCAVSLYVISLQDSLRNSHCGENPRLDSSFTFLLYILYKILSMLLHYSFCLCWCMCRGRHIWRSEDNLRESNSDYQVWWQDPVSYEPCCQLRLLIKFSLLISDFCEERRIEFLEIKKKAKGTNCLNLTLSYRQC